MELFCELKVSFIVSWDGHNRARAVADKNVVANPDGDFFVVDGIDCV